MTNENQKLEITRLLSASPEVVYDAWLDPQGIKKWMCPGEGVTVPNPRIDAKLGGAFDLTMKVGDQLIPHGGEYKVLDRPSKIQFTWKSPGTHQLDTLVTIELKSESENQTKLTLVHEFLPSEESRKDHNGGWTRIVECLEKALNQ